MAFNYKCFLVLTGNFTAHNSNPALINFVFVQPKKNENLPSSVCGLLLDITAVSYNLN